MPKRGGSSTEGKRSGGSLANVTHSPKNIAFPAMPADLLYRAKKTTLTHDARDFRSHDGSALSTMADVMKGFGEAH